MTASMTIDMLENQISELTNILTDLQAEIKTLDARISEDVVRYDQIRILYVMYLNFIAQLHAAIEKIQEPP